MARIISAALPGRRIDVNLTGGEPLLVPHFSALLSGLEELAGFAEIDVITNGTILDEQPVEALARCGAPGSIKVSVESGRASTNDAIRGAGNLWRLGGKVPLLAERTGRPIVLMVTLGVHNARDVDATIDWARSVGAQGVIFERFVPLGTGVGMRGKVLDRDGWAAACDAICRAADIEVAPRDLLPFRAFWLHLNDDAPEPLTGALCNLGDESMALMPDGTVYPCRRLPVPVGNLLEQSFDLVLERLSEYAPSLMRPLLRRTAPCHNCEVSDCAGCRALARAITGDILAADPLCSE